MTLRPVARRAVVERRARRRPQRRAAQRVLERVARGVQVEVV